MRIANRWLVKLLQDVCAEQFVQAKSQNVKYMIRRGNYIPHTKWSISSTENRLSVYPIPKNTGSGVRQHWLKGQLLSLIAE